MVFIFSLIKFINILFAVNLGECFSYSVQFLSYNYKILDGIACIFSVLLYRRVRNIMVNQFSVVCGCSETILFIDYSSVTLLSSKITKEMLGGLHGFPL